MANSRDYRNPNYTEKIKLQRFFTQLQIAASFFKVTLRWQNHVL